ncbi:MAG TPA: ABC transporter permease [Bryobacteraceae bacterium]|nr:ABC transporter permease [Bryobacteraceae bacterium]
MKVRAIALNTLRSLVRDKLLIVFAALFLCVLLLMVGMLSMMKSVSQSADALAGSWLSFLSAIMGMISGLGSLLAAWAAANSVWSEMKSGTILAVMARPVRRWEFLLGKYLGVMMLMAVYTAFLLAMSYLLAWIGGSRIESEPWTLIAYPMVRYAIYGALAMLLVTAMHPVISLAITMVVSVLASTLGPGSAFSRLFPLPWLRNAVYAVLPSTGLLSESRFLTISRERVTQTPLAEHAIALCYGLDYALVLFLLAAWAFRRRSLARD